MPESDATRYAMRDALLSTQSHRMFALIEAFVRADHPNVSWPKQALPLLREAREIAAEIKGGER